LALYKNILTVNAKSYVRVFDARCFNVGDLVVRKRFKFSVKNNVRGMI